MLSIGYEDRRGPWTKDTDSSRSLKKANRFLHRQLPEKIHSLRHLNSSPIKCISDFWLPKMHNNKFVSTQASTFVVICYCSNKKPLLNSWKWFQQWVHTTMSFFKVYKSNILNYNQLRPDSLQLHFSHIGWYCSAIGLWESLPRASWVRNIISFCLVLCVCGGVVSQTISNYPTNRLAFTNISALNCINSPNEGRKAEMQLCDECVLRHLHWK
jgi:hypothetical protein